MLNHTADVEDDDSHLLPAPSAELTEESGNLTVYTARWWILLIFSVFSMMQGWLWGDFGASGAPVLRNERRRGVQRCAPNPPAGPISTDFEAVYGLDDDDVQLLLNYGAIFFVPFAVPFAWWMDRPGGLRVTVVTSLALVAAGAALRVAAPLDGSRTAVGMLHVSYILNDIAGPVAMSACTRVSEGWFPLHERGLATAIATEANILGSAAAYLVGPALLAAAASPAAGLAAYHWLAAGMCAATLLGAIVYFPSHPPTPPTRSAGSAAAAEARFTLPAFGAALRALAANRSFLVLAAAYGLSGGGAAAWGGTLNLNLGRAGFDQTSAGLVGCAGTLVGNAGGLAVGRAVDGIAPGGRKAVLLGLMVGASIATVYFALLVEGLLPFSRGDAGFWQIAVSAAALSALINAAAPLFFELGVEATHPVPEGTVISALTEVYNVGAGALLFVPLGRFPAAFNWSFAAAVVAVTAALGAGFTEASARYDEDVGGAGGGGGGADLARHDPTESGADSVGGAGKGAPLLPPTARHTDH